MKDMCAVMAELLKLPCEYRSFVLQIFKITQGRSIWKIEPLGFEVWK